MSAIHTAAPPDSSTVFARILCATGEYHQELEAVRQASALTGPGSQIDYAGVSGLGAIDRFADHDLVVVPPGDTAILVLAGVPAPVLIARRAPDGTRFPESILVAVDDTREARHAVRLGARLAARHGALISLVATPEHDADHRRSLDGHIAAVVASTGRRPLVLDEHGPPAPAIVAAAASTGASLIVIGRRSGVHSGRVSTRVAHDAGCSVLVVPAEARS